MSLVWSSGFNSITDTDAQAYIAAVEAADGEPLEGDVALAISDFVVGCKLDGIWDAIKASCILAGARTLAGALVPLKGTAPTNYNFVAGDYNRETGLKGTGSSGLEYLDSNRTVDADPQNNHHLSAYLTEASGGNTGGIGVMGAYAGTGFGGPYHYLQYLVGTGFRFASRSFSAGVIGSNPTGLIGLSRSSSAQFIHRAVSANTTISAASSSATFTDPILVFALAAGATNVSGHNNARIAFYSIGESLDLALLDARVTTLINTIGAVLP